MTNNPSTPLWRARVDGGDEVTLPADLVPDLVLAPDGSYSFLSASGSSHRIDVQQIELRSRELTLRVDGRRHRVSLRNPLDQLIGELGLEAEPAPELGTVFAPMPGLVLRIEVTDGQSVEAGDTLLVLEAMKMENAIKAPAAGTVVRVAVAAGQAVEKGGVLVEF